jgi:hypothetical protein
MTFDGVSRPARFLLFIVVFDQIQHGSWLTCIVTLAFRVRAINGTRQYGQQQEKGSGNKVFSQHLDK